MPSWPNFWLFVLLGMFAGFGSLLLTVAYRRVPISVAVPFECTTPTWAALFGFLLWQVLLDGFTPLGAAISGSTSCHAS